MVKFTDYLSWFHAFSSFLFGLIYNNGVQYHDDLIKCLEMRAKTKL